MEYERYKPRPRRPFGMGAFFDFVLAMTKHFDARAARANARQSQKKALAVPPVAQGAEERSAP